MYTLPRTFEDERHGNHGTFSLAGITKIFPDNSATRLVLVDEKSDAFVYNPVSVVF